MKSTEEDPTCSAQALATGKRWRDSARIRFYESLTRNDSVQPVDLILVMAGRMERKHYGLELYRAGLAPRLVLSVGRFEVSKMSQLGLECVNQLKSLRDETPPAERNFFVTMDVSGVRLEKVKLVRWSTYGEALAFRRLLEREHERRVIVVSTDIHLRRVAFTFSKVFRETPHRFLYCPAPTRGGYMEKDNWWKQPTDRWFVFNEMTKLAFYWMALSAPEFVARRLMRLTGWGRK
jgi:uncharacterized SAM-binding protein YcdF (DUF218 family)